MLTKIDTGGADKYIVTFENMNLRSGLVMQTASVDKIMVITTPCNMCGFVVSVVAALLLAGCGGGGGGGSAGPTPFTSYGSIVYPSTVKMSGSAQGATYSYNTGTGTFTSVSAPTFFSSGASITDTWNASHVITNETVTSVVGTTILSLDVANGDVIGTLIPGTGIVYGKSANGQNYILEANHAGFSPAWDYQNFGVWLTGSGTSSGSIGAMTVGAETQAAAIPTTGSATFAGVAAGYYVDGNGNGSFVASNMSATVDFVSKSIAFSTTGSVTSTNLTSTTANSGLNMTGMLTYSGVNQFSGSVSTTGGGLGNAPMTGTASGKFYGPAAQEMGGTFSVSGGGTSAYIGGFGGKR